MEYEIDGKTVNVGTATTATVDDQTVTTVTINEKFIEDTLATKGDNSEILIPLDSESDVVISEFGGDIFNDMEQKDAEIKAYYTKRCLYITCGPDQDRRDIETAWSRSDA